MIWLRLGGGHRGVARVGEDGAVVGAAIRLVVAPELRLFLAARHRGGEVQVNHDGTASLGHVVQSVGPPLTEVGALLVAGRAVPAAYRPRSARGETPSDRRPGDRGCRWPRG